MFLCQDDNVTFTMNYERSMLDPIYGKFPNKIFDKTWYIRLMQLVLLLLLPTAHGIYCLILVNI